MVGCSIALKVGAFGTGWSKLTINFPYVCSKEIRPS